MPARQFDPTPKVIEKESMYRNRTKITQIVYPNGEHDKRIVPPGHTVCLTPTAAKRFFSLFEKVETVEKVEKVEA